MEEWITISGMTDVLAFAGMCRYCLVRPDVLVICHEPAGDWITRAPELIFEIISPKTARRDEGVGHYVIVYPDIRKAKVWRLIDGEYRKVGDFHDELHRFDLSQCAIDIDFSRLWRRLPETRSLAPSRQNRLFTCGRPSKGTHLERHFLLAK